MGHVEPPRREGGPACAGRTPRDAGALRYADTVSHPFLRALDEGASALQAYYAQRQPRSFCEFYGVSPTVAADEQVPCWELPWLHRLRRGPPPGEAGLGAEHGVSYYGPASPGRWRWNTSGWPR